LEAYETLSEIHAQKTYDSTNQPQHSARTAESNRRKTEDKRYTDWQAWRTAHIERIRHALDTCDRLSMEIQYLESLDGEEPSDTKLQEPFDDAKLMQALEENMTKTLNEERDRFKDMYASSAPRHDPVKLKLVKEEWKRCGRTTRNGMIRAKLARLQATERDVQRLTHELETEQKREDEQRREEMRRRGAVKEEWKYQ
jgi:hypothetical protein